MKKLKIIFFVLLALVICLSACSGGKGTDGSLSSAPEEGGGEYIELARIVYSVKTDPRAVRALDTFINKVRIRTGIKLGTALDGAIEEDYGNSLIIGETFLPESEKALSALGENSFSVKAENGFVITCASSGFLYPEALDYLLSVCIVRDGKLLCPADLSHTSARYDDVPVVISGGESYSVVYPAGDGEALALANGIKVSVRVGTGASLEVKPDSAPKTGKEILVGNTSRSFAGAPGPVYLQYGMNYDPAGGDIALSGNVEAAAKRFSALAETSGKAGELRILTLLFGTFTPDGFGDIPLFEGAKFNRITMSDYNSYYLLYTAASLADYSAYLDKLNASGFEEYAAKEVNGNNFSTYTDGYTIVYVSFIDFYGYVRIAVDTFENSDLSPAGSAGEAVTTPQITQINGADAFIIRMEDGRFLLVDGGLNRENIYNAIFSELQKQNVLGGKPVIAAWLLSHPHSDHFGGFIGFSARYADRVTLENVVLNLPSYETYAENTEAAGTAENILNLITQAKNTVANRYPKTRTIIAHAGQELHFGGTVVDILYTHEDLSPLPMKSTNSSSLVYSVTVAGKRIMLLNDAHNDTCQILYFMYGSTLKSDIVQVSHHGYNGGHTLMYKAIAADTALWTSPYATVIAEKLWNNPRNNFDINSVKENLLMEDNSVMTIPLPHKVGALPAFARKFS